MAFLDDVCSCGGWALHEIVKSAIAMYRAIFFIGMVYGNIDAMVLWANKQKSPPAFAKGD
jgi:hypothetical protein